MKKPIIFSVDDDPQVLRAVVRDLRGQFRPEFRILSTTSANEALETLVELRKKNEVVALFLSDQRMPEMLGVDFLEKAKVFFPDAKRVLLTAYSDTDAAIKAINDVQLDYYLMKPWDPPEEKLYPVLEDLLGDWQSAYRPEFEGLSVIGYQFSPRSHEVKDWLAGNLIPYEWLDFETSEKAQELIQLHSIDPKDFPAVIFEDGTFLLHPEPSMIADRLGRQPKAKDEMYDVVVIGAGPAGLAASVYGASEGLKTLLIEKRAPGGQAGTSSRIENYLGFPTGLSGSDLARRAITQATRFGTEFLSPQEVVDIRLQDSYKILLLKDGTEVLAKSIIITTGVDYRKLESPGVGDLTGAGIYYGAATTEAAACKGKHVYVVGGGNSAGQGAMYLSKFAEKVHILVRRTGLETTMSSYLVDQINGTENIEVIGRTVVKEAQGEDHLERLTLENMDTLETKEVEASALFIFIGAKPFTEWIKLDMFKDGRGFIETGRDLKLHSDFGKIWKHKREPFLLETCNAGIFAAGDVRSGAMNRVASAVGEGAMAIKFVHEYLTEV